MKPTRKKLRLDRLTVRDLGSSASAVRGGLGPRSDESCEECGSSKDPNESHAATCGNCNSLGC